MSGFNSNPAQRTGLNGRDRFAMFDFKERFILGVLYHNFGESQGFFVMFVSCFGVRSKIFLFFPRFFGLYLRVWCYMDRSTPNCCN